MEKLVLVTEENGLTEKKAKEIASIYIPMVQKLEEIEDDFNEIILQEPSQDSIPKAKRLRLDIVKIRTDANKVRKTAKDEYLRAGNAIQGAYNTLVYAVKSKEDKLFEFEQHFIEQERSEQARNQELRTAEMLKYGADVENLQHVNLGAMPEDVWNNYVAGQKVVYQAQIVAEAEAEKQRIEREKKVEEEKAAVIKEQKRIKAENEKLMLEAEAKELENQAKLAEEKRKREVEAHEAVELAKKIQAKHDAEQKAIEEKAEAERVLRQKELDLLKAEQARQEKIRAEKEAAKQAELDLIQKELDIERERVHQEQAKRAAEATRIQQEEKKAEQDKLNQGDKANTEDLINDLLALTTKYTFKSEKSKAMLHGVNILIRKTVNHINSL